MKMTDQELIKAAQSALNGAPVEFIVGARCLMPILSERIAALSRVEAERDAAVAEIDTIYALAENRKATARAYLDGTAHLIMEHIEQWRGAQGEA